MLRFDNWLLSRADHTLLVAWNRLGLTKAQVFRAICVVFMLTVAAGIALHGLDFWSALWFLMFMSITAHHEIQQAKMPARALNAISLMMRGSVTWRILRLFNIFFLPVCIFNVAVLNSAETWQSLAHTISALLWCYFVYALQPEAPRKKREPKTVATPAFAKATAR